MRSQYRVLQNDATMRLLRAHVVQMQVEFHWEAKKDVTAAVQLDTAKSIVKAGFVVFHKEPNLPATEYYHYNREVRFTPPAGDESGVLFSLD